MSSFEILKNASVSSIDYSEDEAGFVTVNLNYGAIKAKPHYLEKHNITDKFKGTLIIFISNYGNRCLAYDQAISEESISKENYKEFPWSFSCHAKVKPISVNKAWYMNKKKTKEYLKFQDDLHPYLSGVVAPERVRDNKVRLECDLKFGFSSSLSDVDNCIKTTLDSLQSFFGFDDRIIFKVSAEKFKVNKNEDYLVIKLNEV